MRVIKKIKQLLGRLDPINPTHREAKPLVERGELDITIGTIVLVIALFMLTGAIVVFANRAMATPMPDFGAAVKTERLPCLDLDIVLELRFYDHNPPDPDWWAAVGIGLPDKPDIAVTVVIRDKDQREYPVFIDSDLDGFVDRVVRLGTLVDENDDSWCTTYRGLAKERSR